jgi:hypothetical protein
VELAAPSVPELMQGRRRGRSLQGFVSNATPKKCSRRHKNGRNSTFATFFFWLNVVALVTVAIA